MEGRRSSCRLVVFLALSNMEGEMIVVVCGEGVIIKILLRVWLTHSAHLFVMVCVSVGGWCAGLRHAAWGTGLAELALLGLFSDLTSDRGTHSILVTGVSSLIIVTASITPSSPGALITSNCHWMPGATLRQPVLHSTTCCLLL